MFLLSSCLLPLIKHLSRVIKNSIIWPMIWHYIINYSILLSSGYWGYKIQILTTGNCNIYKIIELLSFILDLWSRNICVCICVHVCNACMCMCVYFKGKKRHRRIHISIKWLLLGKGLGLEHLRDSLALSVIF